MTPYGEVKVNMTSFDRLEQLRARVREFAELFNEHWLLERHGYRSPRQARAALTGRRAALA